METLSEASPCGVVSLLDLQMFFDNKVKNLWSLIQTGEWCRYVPKKVSFLSSEAPFDSVVLQFIKILISN